MAVLSDTDRAGLHAAYMQETSFARTGIALTKAELRAAVNAIDQWVDDNAAAFNSAIPQPARAVLTAKQKSQLFMFVVRRRFEVT